MEATEDRGPRPQFFESRGPEILEPMHTLVEWSMDGVGRGEDDVPRKLRELRAQGELEFPRSRDNTLWGGRLITYSGQPHLIDVQMNYLVGRRQGSEEEKGEDG